jgi:N6-L-threonylcarbamoyladenine synthase
MLVLALETSCDETSVALVREGRILGQLVASQIKLHEEYGGVVPELATREHLRLLPGLARRLFAESGLAPADLEGVVATRGPGLPSALLVGYVAGQSLAFSRGLPFLGIHHHEAHLYSPWIDVQPPQARFDLFHPNVSLVVSGGHTLLVWVKSFGHAVLLGSTLDDAAGECFDKAAKLMGLPYPGGPVLDALAGEGRSDVFRFPRPMLQEASFDFSFSGLKTSLRYWLRDRPHLLDDPQALRDLCAGVQAAIVEVLVGKTLKAARHAGVSCLTASGGVTRNRALRAALNQAAAQRGLELRLADPTYCTDNAAMVGVLGEHRLRHGWPPTPWDEDVRPGWSLAEAMAATPAA